MNLDERLKQAFLRVDADLLDDYKLVCLIEQERADTMNKIRLQLMKDARESGDTELHMLMRSMVPPPYFAITLCQWEGELGLSYYKAGAGRRWACKTCWNFAAPVWSTNDKKCASPDEAIHEYVKWQKGLGKDSGQRPKQETMTNRRPT